MSSLLEYISLGQEFYLSNSLLYSHHLNECLLSEWKTHVAFSFEHPLCYSFGKIISYNVWCIKTFLNFNLLLPFLFLFQILRLLIARAFHFYNYITSDKYIVWYIMMLSKWLISERMACVWNTGYAIIQSII